MIALFFTVLIGLLPIGRLKPRLLCLCGHRVDPSVKIYTSILLCRKLHLDVGCQIRRFNFLAVERLVMRSGASIGNMNFIRGRTSIWMKAHSELGNRNKITRGYVPGLPQPSQLRLGQWSKLTADHTIDLGDSVLIGHNTVVGGLATQVWTHGFIHLPNQTDRIYIRGKVLIGHDCFIGSRSCLSAGAFVGDDISIGAQSSVAGTLKEKGVYVSQKLRHFSAHPHERLSGLHPISGAERAYEKTHTKRETCE